MKNIGSPKITRPALRYYGGKWRLAPWLMQYFPKHDCYVEPYAGAASMFFRKSASKLEVINDTNKDVINFFEVLRDQPDELIRLIDYTPFSRDEYVNSVQPTEDRLERARRFYVRANQGRANGAYMGSKDGGWQFQVMDKVTRVVTDSWGNIDYLFAVAERLKQAFIECDEACNVIRRYDRPATLFYLDPPYLSETRQCPTRYGNEMDKDAHVELADLVHSVEGMTLISGYRSPLYDELYGDWTRVEREALTTGAVYRTECLWISPQITSYVHLPLFAGL